MVVGDKEHSSVIQGNIRIIIVITPPHYLEQMPGASFLLSKVDGKTSLTAENIRH
jgi:hypothetical protein